MMQYCTKKADSFGFEFWENSAAIYLEIRMLDSFVCFLDTDGITVL